MKLTKQNFHVVLLIMLYKMAVTHKSMDEPQCVSTQMSSFPFLCLFFNIVKHEIKDLFFFLKFKHYHLWMCRKGETIGPNGIKL